MQLDSINSEWDGEMIMQKYSRSDSMVVVIGVSGLLERENGWTVHGVASELWGDCV